MSILQGILLGILQGLTEFIPVSSSGHLVVVPWLLGWPAPSLLFDTMVHWGTLAAVLGYFWRDWLAITKGLFRSLASRGPWNGSTGGRLADPSSRLAWGLIVGTLPAVAIGLVLEDAVEALFGSPTAVGVFFIITALILTVSERLGRKTRGLARLTLPDALLIGAAQATAIVPGISRSGATMAAGLGCGLTRAAAARFSFLLSTPVILGAGVLQLTRLAGTSSVVDSWLVVLSGAAAAAISGFLCIRFLLAYLQGGKLYPFAIYCVLAGAAVLVVSLAK